MSFWLDELSFGLEFDEELLNASIIRRDRMTQKAIWDASHQWDSPLTVAPLLIWLATRNCKTNHQRNSALVAAMQCANHPIKDLHLCEFSSMSMQADFLSRVTWVSTKHSSESRDDRPFIRGIGVAQRFVKLWHCIDDAERLLEEIVNHDAPESLPENYDQLHPVSRTMWINRVVMGDLGHGHRAFPLALARLISAAESMYTGYEYFHCPQAPFVSVSLQEQLRRSLRFDAEQDAITLTHTFE